MDNMRIVEQLRRQVVDVGRKRSESRLIPKEAMNIDQQ